MGNSRNYDPIDAKLLKESTAVQPIGKESMKNKIKFHDLTPDHDNVSERKLDGYRNPICDSTTVSSKKVSSASPPNQRDAKDVLPVEPPLPMKKVKSAIVESGSTYIISDVAKKEKTKPSLKRKKRNYESIAKTKATKGIYNTGRWTRLEHFRFLEALKMYGKEWQKVQQHVHTRTSTQARSHAQKFFGKLEKKDLTLDEFLERLDIDQLKLDLRLKDSGNSTEYNEDLPLITIANQK